MALTITLSNTSGASYVFSKILQFQLKKEVYTPYTTFSAQFQTDGLKKFGTICKVIVQNGSQVVHEGTVETLTVQTKYICIQRFHCYPTDLPNCSYTASLHPDFIRTSLSTVYCPAIINFHRKLPWESNSDSTNYVYFNEHIPVWDGVVTLCYKLLERYPYIRTANQVCLHLPEKAKSLHIQTGQTLSYGTKRRYSRLISHFHMQDVDGNYDKFSLTNPQAVAVYQLRHKQIAFDRSYLYNPQKALEFRSAASQNGWMQQFFTLAGWIACDLNDCLSVTDEIENARISAIVWTVHRQAFPQPFRFIRCVSTEGDTLTGCLFDIVFLP